MTGLASADPSRPLPRACQRWGHQVCQLVTNGHAMHVTHAIRLAAAGGGWRDGVVSSVDSDGTLTVDYMSAPDSVVAWHHQDLRSVLPVGSPVRVHEGWHALGGPFGWCNVLIVSGPGALLAELTEQDAVGVVDLRTGRALPLDHEL